MEQGYNEAIEGWDMKYKPKQEAIEDAEKFVEENFKGLSDFIEDADILIWYKALIVSAITDYQYQPKQEAIEDIDLEKTKQKLIESNLVLYRLIKSLVFIELTPRQAKFYQQAEIVIKDSYDINNILRVTNKAALSQQNPNAEKQISELESQEQPQKEYWQPSGNIPNSNWQPDTIEKQVSERIAGYIHEIDSLRGTIRELWEKIESDAVEFVEWILKEEFEMGIYSFFKKDNVTDHEHSPQELYKLFKKKQ